MMPDAIIQDGRCAEEKYREMFQHAPLAVFRTSLDGRFLDANPRLAELLGFDDPGELIDHYTDIGTELYESPAQREAVVAELARRGMYSFEGRFKGRGGEVRDAEVHLRVIADTDGKPLYFEGLAADITDRKRAERRLLDKQSELEESDRRYRTLFDAAADSIFLFDDQGAIRDVNTAACDRLGRERETLLGSPFADLLEPDYARRFREWLPEILESAQPFTARTEMMAADGRVITTEMNAKTVPLDGADTVLCIARDISLRLEAENALRRSREIIEQEVVERTAQLREANEKLREQIRQREKDEEKIRKLAMFDTLTELPNRALILDRLRKTAADVERNDTTAAILYLDLNKFKPINDELGHQAGDQALQAVARRLESCLREVDTAGRIGGDEFVVILQDLARREDVEVVVERLLEAMDEPVLLDGREHHGLGVSVGICFCPRHGEDVDTLIRRADRAMYEAKKTGQSAYRYCDEISEPG